MKFKQYSKYKPSGIAWLGDVPADWTIRKLAHSFTVIGSGTTPKSDVLAYYEDGNVPWLNTGELNDGDLQACEKRVTEFALSEHTSLKIYPADSVVIAMYGATIGKLAILRFPTTVNQACCVFSDSDSIQNKFLFYWFLALRQEIISMATGGGQPNISQDILRSLRIACPTLSNQKVITAFLDRETAKIDTLIAKQEKLIGLLKEKRRAVISHAVTRGIDPTVPMKPSGVEWLGDVPSDWGILPLKHLVTSIEQGWSPQCENYPATRDEWGVLKVGCVNGGIFRSDENKSLPTDLTPLPELAVLTGDLLISRANTRELVGSAAVVEKDFPRLLLCDKLYRLRLKQEECIPQFLSHLLGTPLMRSRIELDASGASSSMLNIGQRTILQLPLALPSVSEQEQILKHISKSIEKIDDLISRVERAIELQKEHRTALISAAVTGKIDVREAVSDLQEAA